MAIQTRKDIAQLGTILSVWAHPDDESFSAAGILAAAVDNGQRVVCVTATRGEQGIQDEARWPGAILADTRQKELESALSVLGIREHHWLGYPDGGCKDIRFDEAVDTIKAFIETVRPASILTFGPEGMTGHDDHKAVSHWVSTAVRKLGIQNEVAVYHSVASEEWYQKHGIDLDKRFNIYFNIDKPPTVNKDEADIAFILDGDLLDRKVAALKIQASQTEGLFKDMSNEELIATLEKEYYILAKT